MRPMTKQIRLNAFDMNCVVHQSPGLWTHPRDRADSYNSFDYWVSLAQLLERGKFDALFLADVLGIYDVYGGGPEMALEQAIQVPVNDPLMIVPAMAYATKNLGFGVTCSLSYEHPYPFARRMSTLDHLTNGRIGWNIVTGYLESAAKGMGRGTLPAHDTRYEIAEDYMDVVYKLWEGSWEDGAVLRDRATRRFADASKIHRVQHDGPYFQMDAIHLCEPSPQRTPLLYQAGASTRGRAFAARHAECVFINGPSKHIIAPIVADIRARAAAGGRNPADIKIFTMMTVITAPTTQAAQDKLAEYRSCQRGRRAGPDVRLDRRGFCQARSGRYRAIRRHQRHDLGAGSVHHFRPHAHMDGARNRPARRHRRTRAGRGGIPHRDRR